MPWRLQCQAVTIGSFFSSLARFKSSSLFSFSLIFTLWLVGNPNTAGSHFSIFFFFLFSFFFFFFFFLIILRSGLLVQIRWSVSISKSQRILCVWFSRTDFGLRMYHLVVWSNFNFLHNSLWITFPNHSCCVLYFLYASLLHSLVMWLIVSSLSWHITCYFVAYNLFLLKPNWSLWRCFELLLKEIQFLSYGFLSVTIPGSLVWDFASLSFEIPLQLYSIHFCFLGFCCGSVCCYIVCSVTGRCN